MLTSPIPYRQLDRRYRRILSFGDVLDESIGLFRRHWIAFALISAVWLIPPGLVAVVVTSSGALNATAVTRELQTGRPPSLASISGIAGGVLLVLGVSLLFYLAWSSAVVIATDEYLHAREPRLSAVLFRTVRRFLSVVLSAILYFLVVLVLLLVSTLIVVVFAIAFPVSIIAVLAALVGMLVWWLQPRSRGTWLKWLIIVAAPWGLAVYFGGSMALYLAAAVLEGRGPIGSLLRSMRLVQRHWFRTVGTLFVAGLIVSVLQYIPTLLIQVPLGIVAAARGQAGFSSAEQAVSSGASIVCQVLFASMATIVYAVVFVDLRNRREGTDLAERVSQLEVQAAGE